MGRLRDWSIAALVLLAGRRRDGREERRRIVPAGPPDRRAETIVLLLLAAGALCAVAFIVVYALDRLPSHTQLLGASLGLAFAFLAAAAILVGKRLVVNEELEEPYLPPHQEEQEEIAQLVEESGSRFTRKKLLLGTAGGAAGLLGLALVTPAVSLGPAFDVESYHGTPWKRGRRLVDESGTPLRADEIEQDVFYTAFPEGADRNTFAAPVVLVRLDPAQLDLPPERAGWAPGGILAYSKICTHAGCAISLYRTPLFEPVEPKPALVCPCHYSTFDVATGGTVVFGPAGRPLPQLPLVIDEAGELRAAGTFSEAVGPSWWGVRMDGPR